MAILASESDLPDGYDIRQFRHEQQFLGELVKYKEYVKTLSKEERQKRALDLVRIVYPMVKGPKGERVAVNEHTSKHRINGVFRGLRKYALPHINEYKKTIDYFIELERDHLENDVVIDRKEMLELNDRISMMLDSCTSEQLKKVAEKYGRVAVGEFPEYAEKLV